MANKIVKYKLTDAGTIPTWIDDGGYYPDPSEVMIGTTVDGSSEVAVSYTHLTLPTIYSV